MRYVFFISMFILLNSCEGQGIVEVRTQNRDFYVDFLFEVDGVKVYRFSDGLRSHYFTTRGETISQHIQHMGKTYYSYDENISGIDF